MICPYVNNSLMKNILWISLFLSLRALAVDHYPFANGTLSVPTLLEKASLQCTGCQRDLSQFIQNKFNRAGDFHGPNCYNTALIASGLFKTNQIRYVSPEEFKALIGQNYRVSSNKAPNTLVVFDAKSSWGHAGFYLGDNLVFHKKSYNTYYHYRISSIDKVGIPEVGEWTPSPFEGEIAQFKWPELGKLPMEFFVLNKKTINYSVHAELLKYLEALIIKDAGAWAFAKNWGLMGVNLLHELKAKLPNQDALTKGMLTSFHDQAQVYFDEVHFKNARNYDRVTEEVCLPQNPEQLKTLYMNLGNYLKINKTNLESKWNQVMAQDKRKCRERFSL